MISALSQDTIRDALTKFATFYDQHRGDMSTWQIEAWRDEHYPSLLPARLYPYGQANEQSQFTDDPTKAAPQWQPALRADTPMPCPFCGILPITVKEN